MPYFPDGIPTEEDHSVLTLIRALNGTKVTPPVYHELIFSYPATDLLPPGKQPLLSEPKDVEYRERPVWQDYALDPSNTEFLQLISVMTGAETAAIPPKAPGEDLLAAISRLSQAPGSSKLEVVAYEEDGEKWHAFRLITDWKLPNGFAREDSGVLELDEERWGVECALAKDESWLRMLQGLMARDTIVAYFHVREKLIDFDADYADEEEKSWDEDWLADGKTLPTARELLCRRITCRDPETGAAEPLGSVDDLEGYGIRLGLPYGHDVTVKIDVLQNAPETELWRLGCKEVRCGMKLFCEDELKSLKLGKEGRRRAGFRRDQRVLKESFAKSNRLFMLEQADIPDAVDKALRKLRCPTSVIPASLCLADTADAREVAAGFRKTYAQAMEFRRRKDFHFTQQMSLQQAYAYLRSTAFYLLRDEAKNKVDAATPVWSLRLQRFVDLWMWRAALEAMSDWQEQHEKQNIKEDVGDVSDSMRGMVMM